MMSIQLWCLLALLVSDVVSMQRVNIQQQQEQQPKYAASSQPVSSSTSLTNKLHVVGYYVNWAIYGRNFQPQQINAEHFTHILYAFANINPDTGEVYLSDLYADVEKRYPTDDWQETGHNVYGCMKQMYLLKKQNRKLKLLLSIGGWTYSSRFAQGISTTARRAKFALSAINIVKDCGFDGLDLDFEYPQDNKQASDYVAVLSDCRKALDTLQNIHSKRTFYLTIAAPAGLSHIEVLHLREMDQYLDFWNVMGYDFAGSWDSTSGHQSNVYASTTDATSTPFNLKDALKLYVAGGVDRSKLVVGIPMYGRAFDNTDGPGEKYNGIGSGSWENGVWDYKSLPQHGATEYINRKIMASWSYDSKTRTMISYDTKELVELKAKWIIKNGLGGAMFWETSSDKEGNDSLVGAVVNVFGGPDSFNLVTKPENNLLYPYSKYDNLKNGMKTALASNNDVQDEEKREALEQYQDEDYPLVSAQKPASTTQTTSKSSTKPINAFRIR